MAVHLLNLLPTTTLSYFTPFEYLFKVPSSYSLLRVFGCLCYPNLSSTSPNKLSPRSSPCLFLGYPNDHKGSRCRDPSTNRVLISRHVNFDESVFPYPSHFPSQTTPPSYDFLDSSDDDPHTLIIHPPPNTPQGFPPLSPPPSTLPTTSPPSPIPSLLSPPPHHSSTEPLQPTAASPTVAVSSPPPIPDPPIASAPPRNSHPMTTCSKSGISKPRQILNLSSSTSSTLSPIPRSHAILDPNWRDAMQVELDALHSNNTWDLVPCPANVNLVGSKWIYRHKFRSNGS